MICSFFFLFFFFFFFFVFFHFWTITLVNINEFSPNLICALILWRSALGLLMDEFRPFLTELSARNTSVFYFQDNNLSKSQWIFTKFDVYIDILEICFGRAYWQSSSIFDRVICPRHDNGGYYRFTFYFVISEVAGRTRKIPVLCSGMQGIISVTKTEIL